ncbi:selenocysteine protein, partial [Candidatus Bathyarchaeota archaeon]|nr:selenocysteine protein [Candidatus Bathyarchaeota archaeon]
HILKKHIPKLFLWIFVPLTLVEFLIQNFDFASLISGMPVLALIVFAALVGVIPESGPHMIFLILFTKGLIPFSVLLVSTLSQDGHGLLPLLSYSVKDTFYVQIFTTGFSLIVGVVLYMIGV